MKLIHFSKMEFFLLMLFLGMPKIVLSFQNYQQRCVYYDDIDNVCQRSRDNINLYISLNDQQQIIKKTTWGFTACSERDPHPNTSITPHTHWSFDDLHEGYEISFFQQEKKILNRFGRLQRYILNATLEKGECQIKWLDYNCIIIGDGTIMHYGIDNLSFPPCEFHLKCQRIWKVQEE